MTAEMNRTGASQFIALERALQIIESLRDVIGPIRRRDVELAQQLLRSANSIAANLSEGRRREGGDRLHLFRIAAGSAEETRTHLRVAVAWGWIRLRDIETSLDLIDQVVAITWRLTHGSATWLALMREPPQDGELTIEQRQRVADESTVPVR